MTRIPAVESPGSGWNVTGPTMCAKKIAFLRWEQEGGKKLRRPRGWLRKAMKERANLDD